jgi:hypothetical protein
MNRRRKFFFESPFFNKETDRLTAFETIINLDMSNFINLGYGRQVNVLTSRMADYSINKLKYIPFRKKL